MKWLLLGIVLVVNSWSIDLDELRSKRKQCAIDMASTINDYNHPSKSFGFMLTSSDVVWDVDGDNDKVSFTIDMHDNDFRKKTLKTLNRIVKECDKYVIDQESYNISSDFLKQFNDKLSDKISVNQSSADSREVQLDLKRNIGFKVEFSFYKKNTNEKLWTTIFQDSFDKRTFLSITFATSSGKLGKNRYDEDIYKCQSNATFNEVMYGDVYHLSNFRFSATDIKQKDFQNHDIGVRWSYIGAIKD
jgi:hypothetical protein